jgi:membrane protease YdiL (CAAX protease family)
MTPATTSNDPAVPRWQILVVLLFPALYILNARMPWAQGLWVDLDKSYFVPFWSSIIVLHTFGAILVVALLRGSGVRSSAIGFNLSAGRALTILLGLAVAGLLAVGLRELFPYTNTDDLGLQIGWPVGKQEQLFWIVVCLFAGVCEELIFRGFALQALRSRGFAIWQAVLISTLSFSLIHGAADVVVTAVSFAAGLMFAGIYVWSRNLALVMSLHALTDLTFILTP